MRVYVDGCGIDNVNTLDDAHFPNTQFLQLDGCPLFDIVKSVARWVCAHGKKCNSSLGIWFSGCGLQGKLSQALVDIVVALAALLSNVCYSAVVMNWDCWPQNDADTVSNMAAIADMLRTCGVLVIDRSQWYRDVAEPTRLFVGGTSGHLKNGPATIAFLTQTMVEAKDLAFALSRCRQKLP